MSGRPGLGEKRFSQNKFYPLLDTKNSSGTMVNPGDATIDIPLTNVSSRGQTGARKMNGSSSPVAFDPQSDANEKTNLFSRRPDPGRRRRTGTSRNSYDDEDGHTFNRMGRIYNAILNFSVITRYLIYVTPLAFVFAIPIVVGGTIATNAEIGGVGLAWFFTWIELIWISLWVSKLFAHFLPYLFQFLVGIVSTGTRKYALIIRALEIPLSLVGWTLCSLATFIPVMTQNPRQRASGDTAIKPWESTVKQVLFALLVCTLILLAEKTLIQLISVSYHRKQYDKRIKESKHNIYLVGQLYEASRSMFPEYCREFSEEDAIISDMLLAGKKSKGHFRSGSATPMKLIQNVGRFGDKVTAAFGNVAHEITGKEVFNSTSAHSIVVHALEKQRSSEALARRIWMSFVVEGREALFPDDIQEVLGADREQEADEAFHMLDRDGNGDISLDEMILTIAEFGRVRKSISRSMHDVDQAINVLDNLLLTVAFIIMVLVFVSFVTTGAGTVIAAGATSLLSLSFVFATTAQEVLGSCIFLFIKHPFDVGDRVEVNSTELFVEEISLLYTVFRTVADHRITQCPNAVLNTQWIDNLTRSKAMRERFSIFVDLATSFGDIQLLKAEMEGFIRHKDNNRDFQPDTEIEILSVGNMDKLELRLEIRHKSNWSNETVRAARRSKFMCALVMAIRKVPIRGPGGGGPALGDPSNPSYSVSISDGLAQEYRDKAAAKREAARMVPIEQLQGVASNSQGSEGATATGLDLGGGSSLVRRGPTVKELSEQAYVEGLHTRRAAFDTARADDTEQLYRELSVVSTNELSAPRGSEDRTSLLREPSTGRRRGGDVAQSGLSLSLNIPSTTPIQGETAVPSSSPRARPNDLLQSTYNPSAGNTRMLAAVGTQSPSSSTPSTSTAQNTAIQATPYASLSPQTSQPSQPSQTQQNYPPQGTSPSTGPQSARQ